MRDRCRALIRMKIKTLFLVLIITLFSCKNSSDKKEENELTIETKVNEEKFDTKDDSEQIDKSTWTSLRDTLKIVGNSIVILRPDSLRFNSYLKSGEDWIYEIDSDFGFGVTKALDSFHNSNIEKVFTDKRFIKIKGCNECPKLIDRDTIDYGIIMISQNKNIQIDQNIYGMEYYLELFNKYFTN